MLPHAPTLICPTVELFNYVIRAWTCCHTEACAAKWVMKNSLHRDNDDDSLCKQTTNILLPVLHAFSSQLKEPLILMLLFSATLSLFLGNTADALSISLALTIVSLVAVIQEYQSKRALEKLADLILPTCMVVRDGRAMDHFPAQKLVMGDLVVLSTGDRVPANVRLIDGVEMMMDESSLMGENSPMGKSGGHWPSSVGCRLQMQEGIQMPRQLRCH